MQDETTSSNGSEQLGGSPTTDDSKAIPNADLSAENVPVLHVYYEIGADLLSKPNALSNIIEAGGRPKTLIFCNAPSDADFVDVLLRKKGIPAVKLIGHVPQSRLTAAVKQLRTGEVVALVITDVSAQHLELGDGDLIVNYSVPSDPEVYLHRCGTKNKYSSQKTFVSLVSPLDIGNFHYLKKFIDFEITKLEPPGEPDLKRVKFDVLLRAAKQKDLLSDPSWKDLTQLVMDSPDKAAIIAHLLATALEPASQPTAATSTPREEFDDEFGDDRGDDRGDRRGPGRDRYSRDRQSSRGGGGGRQRDYNDRYERNDDAQGSSYGRRQYQDNNVDEDSSSEDTYRGPRHAPRPVRRDTRIYLGLGSDQGLSEQKILDLVAAIPEMGADKLQRFILREHYAFADFPEEVSDAILTGLENAELPGGNKLLALKATTINAKAQEDDEREDRSQDDEQSADEQAERDVPDNDQQDDD